MTNEVEKKLSKRAVKTLQRIRNGAFYKAYNPNNPKTIEELISAGLIKKTGRVVVIESCYVPTTGYAPYIPEQFVSFDEVAKHGKWPFTKPNEKGE